jgi:alkanesulfonate monooxygenase SsuD/methylene tetrahydromethanopterin reductase-like flavin-dependent oxidoreductase (luciferase family)
MKFGVALPYSGPKMVAHAAQAAEEAGWDGLYLGDAIWCYDPLIALAAAAMVTTRIRLGTISSPYRCAGRGKLPVRAWPWTSFLMGA